jgi:hypothetical protein
MFFSTGTDSAASTRNLKGLSKFFDGDFQVGNGAAQGLGAAGA